MSRCAASVESKEWKYGLSIKGISVWLFSVTLLLGLMVH